MTRRRNALATTSALVGVLALMLVLAACGGGGGTTDGSASDGQTAAETGAAATAGGQETSEEPVTLEVWDWGEPAPDLMEGLDKAYMELHPNVTIERVHQPFDSYFTLLRTAVASKQGPDIFQTYATASIFDYYDGIIPLTDYVTDEQRQDLLGWANVSAGLDASKAPYAVPYGGQGNVWYYNKELFRQAGLDPESPPATWDEFIAACEALKKAGIVPITAGFKDGYYAEWWFDNLAPQFMTNEELEAFPGSPQWASPAIVKSFEILLELIDDGYTTPNAEGISLFPDTIDAFANGKGAMILSLAGNTAHWGQYRETLGDDLGVFLPPVHPESLHPEPRLDFGPGFGFAITKWSEHPDVAYDLLSFITSAENESLAFEQAQVIPNNTKAQVTSTGYAPADTILEWVTTTPPEKFTGPDFTIRPSVEAVLDKAVPSIVVGQVTIEEALDQVQKAQDKVSPIPAE